MRKENIWSIIDKIWIGIKKKIKDKEKESAQDVTNPVLKMELKELIKDLDGIVDKISTQQMEIDLVKVKHDKRVYNLYAKSSSKPANTVSPAQPQIVGLIDTYDGKESMDWRKPNSNWSRLDIFASKIPIPTQICSNNSKATVVMIKHTKGLYTKEATKFKHNGDLDFFCKMFKKHLPKHGLNTMAQ